jgi:hypothetical protein
MFSLGSAVQNKDAAGIPVKAAGSPVALDGKLGSPAWKGAIALTDFVVGRTQKPSVETRALVTYDKENLYVAVVCGEPDTAKLVANAKGPDGLVWNDDSVEVYVDPRNEKTKAYYGFFVNSKNVTYDRTRDANWSGTWSSQAGVVPGKAWIAELAIPFKTLGITPAPGHKLGVMVARVRKAGSDKGQGMYLVPCNDEAKDTKVYPVLELK